MVSSLHIQTESLECDLLHCGLDTFVLSSAQISDIIPELKPQLNGNSAIGRLLSNVEVKRDFYWFCMAMLT